MTEPERIIKSGLLPSNFLDEEARCDYLVTTQMKKIWAIELDILVEFDRVCKKHGLRYFLMCGTLLGAISFVLVGLYIFLFKGRQIRLT